MKLTPLDIQHRVFKVRLRGYDRQEVNRFREDVAQAVEELIRENAILREKLVSAEGQLAELKRKEAMLTKTLVSAQGIADNLKQSAQREAELIMKEAELKAAELIREARQELTYAQHDLSELRKQRLLAIERLRSTLRSFERMLEIEEGDEHQPDSPDRPEKFTEGFRR